MDDNDVRWVPSQTPIPALQELIREAERDKNAITQLSLLDPCALPSAPTRTTPPPSAHRKPLALSASLSQASNAPLEEQPEALAFVELLKGTFERVDEKALKKQREAARAKEKQRGLASNRGDPGPRPLTKTSSASAICPTGPSKTSTFSTPDSHGRALAKTASLGPRSDVATGKSTPPSLPSHSLNPKPASAPQLPVRVFTPSNPHPATARRPHTAMECDSPIQDVIDLTETDTDWEQPITSLCMKVDDDDSDSAMDISFFRPEPPSSTRIPSRASKSKPQLPQPSTASHPPPPPIHRARTGPPLLGMRRPAYLPPSQCGSTQGTKGGTVPRFKPPLLTRTASMTTKSVTLAKPGTADASGPPSRAAAAKLAVAPKVAQQNGDPDSSFDVSFDMDIDELEETMKAYD